MQTREEHQAKVEKGICPLCGSTMGFINIEIGEGEYYSNDCYCKECDQTIY